MARNATKTRTKANTKQPSKVAIATAAAAAEVLNGGGVNSIFDECVDFVLLDRIEGGYVNDPRDPGGETNFGISKRSYPKVNMKTLTREGAVEIYKRDYWDAAGCDDLPSKVALVVFDCAVNQGVGIARRLLQKALGVRSDGVIGPKTLAAVKKADEQELMIGILGWRLRRYAFTANAATYMRGWSNRVIRAALFAATELEAG